MDNDIIYSHRVKGTYCPQYDYYEIHKDGTVKFEGGQIYNEKERIECMGKIPQYVVDEIERIIKDNPRVFVIDEITNNDYCCTDGAYTTFFFSYRQSKNEIEVYDIERFVDLKKDGIIYRDALLLIKIERKIERILTEIGINPQEICYGPCGSPCITQLTPKYP